MKEHLPLCFCLKHISHYPYHQLPAELEEPRVRFHDREKTSERDFYLTLLHILKEDVKSLHNFTKDALSIDRGPLPYNQMSEEEFQHHLLTNRCSFCGSPYSFRNPPQRHHNHLETSRGGSISICRSCNLNAPHTLNTRSPLTIFCLNGRNYDFLLCAVMILEYGTVKHPVLDGKGRVVSFKPLVKSNSRILLKNSSEVLTLSFSFNYFESSCAAY